MSKATTVQLACYHVTNNIKRNVGTFLAAFQNTNDALSTNYFSVAASGIYTFTPPAGNKILIASVSSPLQVLVTFTSGAETITQTLSSLLVLDMEVTSIEFNNPSASPIDVVVIGG